MATLDAAPQFGAELKVLFVWDNYLLVDANFVVIT